MTSSLDITVSSYQMCITPSQTWKPSSRTNWGQELPVLALRLESQGSGSLRKQLCLCRLDAKTHPRSLPGSPKQKMKTPPPPWNKYQEASWVWLQKGSQHENSIFEIWMEFREVLNDTQKRIPQRLVSHSHWWHYPWSSFANCRKPWSHFWTSAGFVAIQ